MRLDVKRAFAGIAIIAICSMPVALLLTGAPDESLWYPVGQLPRGEDEVVPTDEEDGRERGLPR